MEGVVTILIEHSDPINAALVGVVWWRLDRRIRSLRGAVESDDAP